MTASLSFDHRQNKNQMSSFILDKAMISIIHIILKIQVGNQN